MKINGNGIAFISWCLMCTLLEIFADGANGLWGIAVIWCLFGEFNSKES